MRTNKQSKKILLVSGVVLLFIFCAILVKTGVIQSPFTGNAPTPEGPTKAEIETQKKAEAQQKQEYLDSNNQDNGQPTATQSNTTNSAKIVLTAKQEGSSVTVLARMDGVSSGSCSLKASQGSKRISLEADLIYQPEFSSCAGFSLPVSQLGPGTWDITLDAHTNVGQLIQSTTLEVK